MKQYSFTTPDLGGIEIPIGTKLIYAGYEYDDQPQRQGWVWYNFVALED